MPQAVKPQDTPQLIFLRDASPLERNEEVTPRVVQRRKHIRPSIFSICSLSIPIMSPGTATYRDSDFSPGFCFEGRIYDTCDSHDNSDVCGVRFIEYTCMQWAHVHP